MQSTKRYQGSCRMPYWYTQTKGPNPLNFHLESPPVTVRNSELEMAWFIWCDIITEQQMSRLRDMHYIAKPHGRAALVSVRVRPSIIQCHALKVSLSVCLSVCPSLCFSVSVFLSSNQVMFRMLSAAAECRLSGIAKTTDTQTQFFVSILVSACGCFNKSCIFMNVLQVHGILHCVPKK